MHPKKLQLHVVFGRSAAATLRQALEIANREEAVVAPYDDLSFGPIDTDDTEARARWVESELYYSDWEKIIEDSLSVLKASKEADEPPIAWVSPDCAHSVAGFLWWLSHVEDRECLVLEVPRLSQLDPNAMSSLIGHAIPFTAARRAGGLTLWGQLQAENAPLRVLEDHQLKSAPIEYFDADLLNKVTAKWQKMAKIIGRTLCDFDEAGVFQTGELVLAARLTKFAETGIIESQGDLSQMRYCELRRSI